MTKEEYRIAYQSLSKQANEIKIKQDAMECDYLKEHLIAQPGDKVKVVATDWRASSPSEHTAYVYRVWASSDGEINYSFWKARKDGSESFKKLHLSGKIHSIELLEPAIPNT